MRSIHLGWILGGFSLMAACGSADELTPNGSDSAPIADRDSDESVGIDVNSDADESLDDKAQAAEDDLTAIEDDSQQEDTSEADLTAGPKMEFAVQDDPMFLSDDCSIRQNTFNKAKELG